MIQYKHSITGIIATLHLGESYFDFQRCYDKICSNERLHKSFIEDSSDWEKLQDSPTYEILNVASTKEHTYYLEPQIFTWEECNKDFKFWNIHSFKRLSDGKIFTIGDLLKKDYKIISIAVNEDLSLIELGLGFGDTITKSLLEVKRLVKNDILFITIDGVAIKDGDTFWVVNNNNYSLSKAEAPHFTNNPSRYTRFSTEGLAVQFIVNNKPVLSISDIPNQLDNKLFILLEGLVRERLNY